MTETTDSRFFPTHTLESAPSASRKRLQAAQAQFGFVPLPLARHASAPSVLEGFALLHEQFEATSLSPLAREVVALTMARRLDCKLCRALHSQLARARGATPELVEALLRGEAIPSRELAGVARLTERTLDTHGAVGDSDLKEFFDHGYTAQQALEVVVGIAAYTLSILANRMTQSEMIR